MNKVLLGIFCLLLNIATIAGFGQTVEESKIEDQITKARELMQTGSSSDMQDAKSISARIIASSQQLGYRKGSVEGLNIMADIMDSEGQTAMAIKLRKRATKIANDPNYASNPIIIDNSAPRTSKPAPASPEPVVEERRAEPEPEPAQAEQRRVSTPATPTKTASSSSAAVVEKEIQKTQNDLEEAKRKLMQAMNDTDKEHGGNEAVKLMAEIEALSNQVAGLSKEKEMATLRDEQQRQIGIILICGIVLALLLLFFVIRQYLAKNRANREMEKKNAELATAYDSLHSTQAQLVQKEKLASLGQLTAGIAHEIQNPLNFVNNFSDLSIELMQEIQESNNVEEIKEISGDVIQNLQKIHTHGQRAASIVRNMLQHSREQKGDKEPTNINELLGEYFNLAFHGIRATDKDFNCKMNQELQPNLPAIPLIKQDVGRVFLNMFNNSFYSVSKKTKISAADFVPTVSVKSVQSDDKIVITLRDNGMGMSREVQEKLFNPFFTTKPTGEGTGLGLSISHDIIVKIHGGTIAVDSKEGEYAQFTITLPIA
jgi:signal transduction histidine kinase